jgi:uncharacterized protein YacL
MSSIDKELLRIIRRIRDRLHTASIINCMLLGVIAALCAGVILVVAARFLPLYSVYMSILKMIGTALLCAFLYSAFKTPKDEYAALKADSLGLKERTITALELIGSQSAFALLEKNDALKELKGFDYRKKLPLRPNKKYILICVILTAVLAVSGFLPNPMAGRAEELHKLKTQISEQQKLADKLAEKVRNNPKLSDEQKKELEKKLTELKRELKNAEDEKEMKN